MWTARQREGETERAAHAKRIARRRGCRAYVPTAHRTATKPTTRARGLHTFIMAGGRPVCARRVAVWKRGRAGPRCAGRPAGERQAGRQETFDINRSTQPIVRFRQGAARLSLPARPQEPRHAAARAEIHLHTRPLSYASSSEQAPKGRHRQGVHVSTHAKKEGAFSFDKYFACPAMVRSTSACPFACGWAAVRGDYRRFALCSERRSLQMNLRQCRGRVGYMPDTFR